MVNCSVYLSTWAPQLLPCSSHRYPTHEHDFLLRSLSLNQKNSALLPRHVSRVKNLDLARRDSWSVMNATGQKAATIVRLGYWVWAFTVGCWITQTALDRDSEHGGEENGSVARRHWNLRFALLKRQRQSQGMCRYLITWWFKFNFNRLRQNSLELTDI